MNVSALISELMKKEESTILEFKREWYWEAQFDKEKKEKAWGELLKDIIALANSHPESHNKERYMLIGFDEIKKDVWHVDLDIGSLKQEISKKLIQYTNITEDYLKKIEFHYVNFDNKKILLIILKQPDHLLETTKNIKTNSLVYPSNSILMRGKTSKIDEVGLASTAHITQFHKNLAIDVKSIENEIIDPQFLHRSIKVTMQEYLKLNHNLKNFSKDYPKIYKDNKKKIYYEIYCFSDEFNSEKKFIYIHDQATQYATYTHLKNQNELNSNLMILTDRPLSIKDSEKRISNLKNHFKDKPVYFIDQFGRNHVYRRLLEQFKITKFDLDVYIKSFATQDEKKNEEIAAIQILQQWYDKVNEPIFIVQGDGGIGKTTLVQHFLNKIIDKKDNEVQILFIDSSQIINELNNLSKKIKIYDFYKAKQETEIKQNGISIDLFTEDLLRVSVDDGNVIIVLDGIDEVISSLGSSFNINTFIENIVEEYSFNLCRCKIIITCRNHFWGNLEINREMIKYIDLLPFNEEQAKDFFSQSLIKESQSLISKSLNFAKQFSTKSNENALESPISFSPFVLDTILYLAKKDDNFLESDYLDSDNIIKYLNLKNSSNDFLIYTVFEREYEKLKQLNSSEQLKFFINLASMANGEVSIAQLSKIFGENLDDARVNSLMAHPFLRVKDDGRIQSLLFKYDFFNVLFKGIYLTKSIVEKNIELIDDIFFNVLNSVSGFDNNFTKSICERMILDDEIKLFFLDIIQKIKINYSENEDFKFQSISSIFTLYLSILKFNNQLSNNDHLNTAMTDLFCVKDKTIEGLSLINIKKSLKKKLIFDFSDFEILDSNFIDYDFFWECIFNENTKFKKCRISSIISQKIGKKNSLSRSNFIDCRLDQTIIDKFNEIDINKLSNKDKIKKEVLGLLKLFIQNLNFYPQKEARIKSYSQYSNLYPKLLELGVINIYNGKLNETEVAVSPEYSKLIKCITQKSPSIELNDIVDKLTI